jgi:hypothetical protein
VSRAKEILEKLNFNESFDLSDLTKMKMNKKLSDSDKKKVADKIKRFEVQRDKGNRSPEELKKWNDAIDSLKAKLDESLNEGDASEAERLLPILIKELEPKAKGKFGGKRKEHLKALDGLATDEEGFDRKEINLILQLADMYGVK